MTPKNGMPSPEFRQTLRQVFGIKKPKKPKDPAVLPIHDEVKKERPRAIGNVMLSAEAQRIYSGNPLLPSQPGPMKPPTAPQVNRGTVGGMDNTGPWGTAQEKK